MDNISDCKDTTLFPNSQIFIIIFLKIIFSTSIETIETIKATEAIATIATTIIIATIKNRAPKKSLQLSNKKKRIN